MPTENPTWLTIVLFLVAGFILLGKGADWLVSGASAVARRVGVSTLAIGLTVVAWGTSAPEVVVSSMAAYQGSSAISLGNVLGSNIANIGLVLGTCAIVLPRVMEARLGRRDTIWLFGSLAGLWFVVADGCGSPLSRDSLSASASMPARRESAVTSTRQTRRLRSCRRESRDGGRGFRARGAIAWAESSAGGGWTDLGIQLRSLAPSPPPARPDGSERRRFRAGPSP